MTTKRDSGLPIGLGFSLLFHGILGIIIALLPFPSSPTKYREVIIELPRDPSPIDVTEVLQEPDTPLSDALEDAIVLEEVAPLTPSVPASAPLASVPAGRPSDQDLLAEVADLAALAGRAPRSPPLLNDSRRSALSEAELAQTQDLAAPGRAFLDENQVAELPQTSGTPTINTTPSTNQNPRRSISEEIATLLAQMSRQAESSGPSSPVTSSSSGFIDPQIDGNSEVGGRGLVSATRLDLSKYLTQINPNWPRTLRVSFRVNARGFITAILNEGESSLYTDLQLAVYQLFIRDGQAFVAVDSPAFQEGSITFRLR